MSIYTIVPRRHEAGFNVEIVGADGARNTVLGFNDEADAAMWVAAAKKHERTFQRILMHGDQD